jgi:hypothetical protein
VPSRLTTTRVDDTVPVDLAHLGLAPAGSVDHEAFEQGLTYWRKLERSIRRLAAGAPLIDAAVAGGLLIRRALWARSGACSAFPPGYVRKRHSA